MNKEQTIPVATRLTLDEVHAIKLSGESNSDFIKNAVKDKLECESLDFVNKNIQDLEEEIRLLLLKKELIKKKQQDFREIPKREIPFLIETKELLERQPNFTKGRISKYLIDFQKQYTISEPEFFNLLQEAENQSQEKKAFQSLEK